MYMLGAWRDERLLELESQVILNCHIATDNKNLCPLEEQPVLLAAELPPYLPTPMCSVSVRQRIPVHMVSIS